MRVHNFPTLEIEFVLCTVCSVKSHFSIRNFQLPYFRFLIDKERYKDINNNDGIMSVDYNLELFLLERELTVFSLRQSFQTLKQCFLKCHLNNLTDLKS